MLHRLFTCLALALALTTAQAAPVRNAKTKPHTSQKASPKKAARPADKADAKAASKPQPAAKKTAKSRAAKKTGPGKKTPARAASKLGAPLVSSAATDAPLPASGLGIKVTVQPLPAPSSVAAAAPESAGDPIAHLLAAKSLPASSSGYGISYAALTPDRASQLLMAALGHSGAKYRLGGTSRETGFDCSGFVQQMYHQAVGLKLPRDTASQAAATQAIDVAHLAPGDLVFFNTQRRAHSHVGIYMGEGKFIHAPRTGQSVRVENMNARYWKKRFDGARRVALLHEDSPAAAPLPLLSSLAHLGQSPAAYPVLPNNLSAPAQLR